MIETQPLVSAEVCNAFPIALVIAFMGLCALFAGWQLIIDALHWQRFCRACGGRRSAHRVLEEAEETARTSQTGSQS